MSDRSLLPLTRAYRIDWKLVAAPLAVCAAIILLADTGSVLVLTEILIMVLFASSLNLIMSYGGMVSFGHAAYFGLGAYGFALSLARFDQPLVVALMAGPLVAALAAAVFGALCVRLTHIYFAMLTLACAQIVFTVLFQWYDFTGGDTGLTGFMSSSFGLSPDRFALLVLAVVTVGLLVLWRTVHSPLGLSIRAAGADPHRAAASGADPRRIQLVAFVISGALAGVAGMLFAVFRGSAFPDYAGIGFTIDVLIMVVIGGLGSFAAGIYGAIIYTLLRTYVPLFVSEWELVVGIVLLVVVLWSPTGFAGSLSRLARMLGRTPA